MRDRINYYFPMGYKITYVGSEKPLYKWIFGTWRGYLAMWKIYLKVILFLIANRLPVQGVMIALVIKEIFITLIKKEQPNDDI